MGGRSTCCRWLLLKNIKSTTATPSSFRICLGTAKCWAQKRKKFHRTVLNEILQEQLEPRRNRHNFRGVKRKMSNFPIRRRDRKALPPLDIGEAIRIVK